MIGILLITHGKMGALLRQTAEEMIGVQRHVEVIEVGKDSNPAELRANSIQAMHRLNSGEGVIVLTDMFGGAASNLAMSLLSFPKVEVISGMNLPMVLKLYEKRAQLDLKECATIAQSAAVNHIHIATEFLEPMRKAG